MKTGHIKFRNLPMQIVLVLVTLGIYVIYWYYVTLKELHIANGNDQGVAMWTLLGFLPIASYFSNWHYSCEFDGFSAQKYPTLLLFLAFIAFPPVVWFVVQTELNAAASGGAAFAPREAH